MQLPFAIRDLGQRLFRNVPVRIRSGINRGMKWSIVTSGRGYGSGAFGDARLAALKAIVQPGETFWDIGAHKGFVALAASHLVGPTGSVVAVEPSSRNRWFIQRHLTWNGIDNVVVVGAAVSAARGEARFGGRGDSLAYALGRGDETVPVRTVPDIVEEHGVSLPSVLKIDAEGQEAAILEGARTCLGPGLALLISVHGRELHGACTAFLRARGFRLFESGDMARCSADPAAPWTSDYDILAVGPERPVEEALIRRLSLFSRG
jgi:FkbM family methyltransferase